MKSIILYFLKLGAHIGSSISVYNYSSSLNQYLLGSMYNFYIIDLKKSLYLLKRALYFLISLGINNAHLLFFYFLNSSFKIYFFFLIKKKNKHSFVNEK
jgi:ribosomal protein S2